MPEKMKFVFPDGSWMTEWNYYGKDNQLIACHGGLLNGGLEKIPYMESNGDHVAGELWVTKMGIPSCVARAGRESKPVPQSSSQSSFQPTSQSSPRPTSRPSTTVRPAQVSRSSGGGLPGFIVLLLAGFGIPFLVLFALFWVFEFLANPAYLGDTSQVFARALDYINGLPTWIPICVLYSIPFLVSLIRYQRLPFRSVCFTLGWLFTPVSAVLSEFGLI